MNKYIIQKKLFNFYCLYDVFMMYFLGKMSPKIQRYIQNVRLRKLIRKAYRNPFYRKRFDKAGIKPKDIKTREDLKKLPSLSKAEYREWMQNELNNPQVRFFHLTHTSGSTGIPATNIFPPREYATHYIMDMFCWIKGGYNPFLGKTMTCAPGDINVGTHLFVQKLGILRRKCFCMKWDREKIINEINNYKPDFLLGYSAELVYIAQYALENNIPVHKPRYYCAGGEHVIGEPEQILKTVFGDGMINYYGCTEMADFASRLPNADGYEVNECWIALNVITDKGIKSSGEGRILATPLYRTHYPLINYEIGDIVVLTQKDGLDYISDVYGREQDIFYWKSGKQTTHKDIWLVSRELEDIYQIKFIQESFSMVTIQVVKDKKSLRSNKELERYLLKKYEKLFDNNVTISFEWLPEIPPDPNGKIRNMISKIRGK